MEIISKRYINLFLSQLKAGKSKTVYVENGNGKNNKDKIVYQKYVIKKYEKVIEQKIK